MGMLKNLIREFPFDWLLTNENGMVVNGDTSYFSIEDVFNKKLTDSIEEWMKIDNEISLGKKNGENFVLIQKGLDNGYTINLLVKTDTFHQLFEKVKELNKSVRELDAIIESSYDGIYITDIYGNTLRTNSAIERITGIPKHYYIGKNTKDLIKRGILKESVTEKVLKERKTVTVVYKNINGKETLLTGNPIFNEQGEIEKVVTNIRDLSELNELNEKLKEAEKLNKKFQEEIKKLRANTIFDSETVIKSKKMIEIYEMVSRLSHFDTTILILGETGVGKDMLVKHLYRNSPRFRTGKLIKVNCGAIPKDLLESELFGYEGGAFSGASRSGKMGMFELADQGILFLDEIGELPLHLQVKLLRAIQEKEIMRVGGTEVKKIDIQLVAATNRNLKEMVDRGEFREDLYYRLNVVPITIPPLRERRNDILPLIHHYVNKYNQKYQFNKYLDRGLKSFFYYYDWPGNIRELSNLVERLILTVPNDVLTVHDLPYEYQNDSIIKTIVDQEKFSLKSVVEQTEKMLIERVMKECRTTYELAEKLKTSQATIVRKLQKYNLTLKNL